MIKIEIIYIDNQQQTTQLTLALANDSTVEQALAEANFFTHHPELEGTHLSLGIFSRKASLDTTLSNGDRVEIYRPLTISPMDKRRLLAEKRRP